MAGEIKLSDYEGGETAWCPGCGNFAILRAAKEAFVELGLRPHELLMVSGIGQAAKLPHYTKGNVFNGLHGRSLPVATGAKIANRGLTVVVFGGDGDLYGEGGNHLLHAMRRNVDITVIAHDNQIYGLTKGQASPTSDPGLVTKVQPDGVVASRFDPLSLAIVCRAGFVARAFAGDVEHLRNMIVAGVRHKGFTLIDVLQPCVSFNRKNTYAWYKERVYKLGDDHDPTDAGQALARACEWGDNIPIGVVYNSNRAPFEESLPALAGGPLAARCRDPSSVERLLDELR